MGYYEKLGEKFIRACKTMEDEEQIRKWYFTLKDFSEDDFVGKCDFAVGEAIRARSIVYYVGLYFAETDGEEREALKEDIIGMVNDFYDY